MLQNDSDIENKGREGLQNFPLKEILPIASALIIISAVVKAVTFYSEFNIPVKYFFSLSEILLIAVEDLIRISVILISILVLYMTFFSHKKSFKQQINFKKEPLFPTKRDKYFKVGKYLLIFGKFGILSLFIGLAILGLTYFKRPLTSLAVIFSVSAALVYALVFYAIENYTIHRVGNMKLYATIWILVIVLLYQLGFTSVEMEDVRHGKYKGTTIETERKIYTTYKDTLFIGKNEKYVFLFNKVDSSAIILPSDNIKQLTLKESIVSLETNQTNK